MNTLRIGQTVFTLLYEHLLPPLTADEYAALKADILTRGVLVPVVIDEQANVIDGQHRLKIAAEAKIKAVPFVIRPGLSPAEKMQIALNLNVNRRHLSRQQLRELAGTLRHKGLSFRQIGQALGMSHTQAKRASGTIVPVAGCVVGVNGKRYAPSVIAKRVSEVRRASSAFASVPEVDLPSRMIDLCTLSHLARNARRRRNGERTTDDRGELVQLLFGDFRDKGKSIESDTVDLIFTDPPYCLDALPVWDELGRFAARVLKPGGVLATYSGVLYLPDVLASLGEHLDYVWTCCINFSLSSTVFPRRVRQRWKPVVLFTKPPTKASWNFFNDTFNGGPEKTEHDWQQSESEAEHVLRALCPAGGLVVDPFLGSGTTALVAKRLGLRCIGIDNDPAAFAGAVARCSGKNEIEI